MSVVQPFADVFRLLENEEDLDPLNQIDIFCLNYIFLPWINRSLESFMRG